MTPADFASWVAHMRGLGYPEYKLAKLLGCGRNQITLWRVRESPRYIGLACAAIERGIEPWTTASMSKHTGSNSQGNYFS